MKTKSEILEQEFEFETRNLGLFVDDNLWMHDKWAVIIEGQTFDYSAGIGHREAKDKYSRDKFNNLAGKNNLKQTRENLTLYLKEFGECSKPKPLKIDDILYSLIMDADSGRMLFEEFCDNFGYRSDSIKALDTYRACQQNVKKVLTFIKDLDKAQELFHDY